MSKLEQFKLRAERYGQTITIYPFVAHPSGDYVDPNSGYPDPEDPDYPASAPADSYGTAVAVKGFVQTTRWKDSGQWYVKQYQGEDEPTNWVAYLPGDTVVTMRSLLVVGADTYEVMRINENRENDAIVVHECFLRKKTP